MKKALSEATKQKNEAARRHYSNKQGVICTKFKIESFVLSGDVTKHAKKLVLRWTWRYRVVSSLNDWVYEIQELVEPYDVHTRHASCLRIYKKSHLEVT